MDNTNPIASFIKEVTIHIQELHAKCESLLIVGEAQTQVICDLRERIVALERENERIKQEMEQISLLN